MKGIMMGGVTGTLVRVGCVSAAYLTYRLVKRWFVRRNKREARKERMARRKEERARRKEERAKRELEREYGVGVTPMEYAMFFPCTGKPEWGFKEEVDIDMTPFIHKEDHIVTIIGFLDRTEKTLDICMYLITHTLLSDATIRAKKRGVEVRIITEYDHVTATKSQVPRFSDAGIPVATKKGSYIMHNKFVIMDGKYCMMGSLNWTNQAIYGNWEHCLISNNKVHIGLMQGVFNALWDEFQGGGDCDAPTLEEGW